MKKIIFSLLLMFSFVIASFAFSPSDSIKKDAQNLNIKVQVEGKFNDPTINFSKQSPIIDVISDYYTNKIEQSDQLIRVLDKYVYEIHAANEINNKSPDLIRINELGIKDYNKTIKTNSYIYLTAISIFGLFFMLTFFTNISTFRDNYSNLKILQITIFGLLYGAIVSLVVYTIISVIINPDIFLVWKI